MWRRLLYLVCIVEAGALAAVLAALVIDPSLAAPPVTPGVRRLCAVAALALMLGSGYAAARLLYDGLMSVCQRVKVQHDTESHGSLLGALDLAQDQSLRAHRAGRGGRVA